MHQKEGNPAESETRNDEMKNGQQLKMFAINNALSVGNG
ncbi:MAG: hypothetical protein JWR19_4549 [Pedosphaera sp.]|nr:hypothetical protein [Pedosphaera sp.]